MVYAQTANPWVTGVGFYLSSTNTNANHWYCSYGTTPTLVDSSLSATVAWARLTMVSDGTNLHWYVNGTQVCGTGVALTNITTDPLSMAWTSTTKTASTHVYFDVDYVAFQRALTR
jgi:hypothetical protein